MSENSSDSEEDEIHTNVNRAKQRKLTEETWQNAKEEEVEKLPIGINGINVYAINVEKEKKNYGKILKDGRKWKKNCPTSWKGHIRVRYANCKGSYRCNSLKCPYRKEYGVVNTVQFEKKGGSKICKGCGNNGNYVPCMERNIKVSLYGKEYQGFPLWNPHLSHSKRF